MPHDLPRLVAGCRRDLLQNFIAALRPEKKDAVDWNLPDRQLASALTRAFSDDSAVWSRLQNIESLAYHGGTPVIRSVLYKDDNLLQELDGLDATDETAAVWLALTSDQHFQFALSALHADLGLRKRSGRGYRVPFSSRVALNFDDAALERFREWVRAAIAKARYLDPPGRLEAHHFKRIVSPGSSHRRRVQDQVTVYAEMRNVTERAFDDADQLVTRRRKRIDQISVVFDRARRELDIVTIGGRDFIQAIAVAFCACFSNERPRLERLVRRHVDLQRLMKRPDFSLEGQDLVQHASIDEIRLRSPTGSICTFARKSRDASSEDVYDFAEREFGAASPFAKAGWTVESARLRLTLAPNKVGQARRVRTIHLRLDGRTNLREHEDTNRLIADELLVRWGLLEADRDGDY
jgi:hypothetical protein